MWKSVIAALLAAFVISGCAQLPPDVNKSAPASAPSPVATATTTTVTPAHETASPLPTREAELKNLAVSAGFVVARWLETEYPGETERMVFEDQAHHYIPTPWQQGMSGWGTLSLNWGEGRNPASTTARVVVYFDESGHVDYSQPIKSVWLDLGATSGDLLAGISWDIDQESWVTWLSSSSTAWYPIFYSCVPTGCYSEGGEEPVESPAEIKLLDDRAAFSLGQSMALQFGYRWEEGAPKG